MPLLVKSFNGGGFACFETKCVRSLPKLQRKVRYNMTSEFSWSGQGRQHNGDMATRTAASIMVRVKQTALGIDKRMIMTKARPRIGNLKSNTKKTSNSSQRRQFFSTSIIVKTLESTRRNLEGLGRVVSFPFD